MSDATKSATPGTPFVNEVRLSARQWVIALGILIPVILMTPWIWKVVEKFETGGDYRIPYALSKDYWLYQRRVAGISATNIVVLGDSVVWGEYVLPEGTLSHFLNQESARGSQFVNAGVNGMFPLALEGLVRYYGMPIRGKKVILQCNPLWMSSPKADLQTEKEEQFNHSRLVPQYSPRIPCYRADASERLGAIAERNLEIIEWANHLQSCYFGQKSVLQWTLEDDGADPPHYPNVYKNPFAQIALRVPGAPADDPDRGPKSARHKPWSTSGKATARFEWVKPESSLQWSAFQRLVRLLQERGNEVLVVVGPFNEHMLAPENRPAYGTVRDAIGGWLSQNHIAHLVPEPLPSLLYADASHPLTDGYQMLASEFLKDPEFQKWLGAAGN